MSAFECKPITITNQDGFFWDFKEYYRIESNSNSIALPLAGALATLSAMASHRIVGKLPHKERRVTPNLYVLSSARSGTGKQTIKNVIERLLDPHKLLGISNYGSNKAIVQGLPTQQARLDIIDEAQGLMRKIKGAKESWESEIVTTLCDLFTSAGTEFRGFSSMHLGQNFGRVIQPHLNIYATGVFDMEKYFVESLMSGGFLARFLYFKEPNRILIDAKDNPVTRGMHFNSMKTLLAAIDEAFPKFITIPSESHLVITTKTSKRQKNKEDFDPGPGNTYRMHDIEYTKEVEESYWEFYKQCSDSDLGNMDSIVQRLAELSLKVCQARFLAIQAVKPCNVIDLENWEWSKNVVLNSYKNFFEASDNSEEGRGRENNFSDRAMKIYNYLKKRPEGRGRREIDKSLLRGKRVFENAADRDGLIKYLMDAGFIYESVKNDEEGNPSKVYIAK